MALVVRLVVSKGETVMSTVRCTVTHLTLALNEVRKKRRMWPTEILATLEPGRYKLHGGIRSYASSDLHKLVREGEVLIQLPEPETLTGFENILILDGQVVVQSFSSLVLGEPPTRVIASCYELVTKYRAL